MNGVIFGVNRYECFIENNKKNNKKIIRAFCDGKLSKKKRILSFIKILLVLKDKRRDTG